MSGGLHDDVRQRTRRRDRAIIRGTFSTGLGRLVAVASSFATLGIVARVLTEDEFGLVAVLISLWLILTMFDLGLGGALTTRVAVSHGRDDPAEARAHAIHALLALAAIGGLIAVVGTVSAVTMPWRDWIGGDVSSSTITRCLVMTFVAAGAALPAATGFMCLNGLQRFATTQLGVAAGGVAAAGASAAAVLANPPPEVFVLIALGCPLVVSSGFTAWVMLGVLRSNGSAGGFERARFMSMVRASGYYALYNFSNTISLGTGTIIVGSVRGLAEAAVFNVAIRLFIPVMTVIAASGAQLWPSMTEAISRGDVTWAKRRYRHGLVTVIAVSGVVCLALVVAGPWIAELWVGSDLVPTRGLLLWTAILTVTKSVASQISVVVLAVERTRAAAGLAVCAAIVGVPASIVLTQTIGASGAVIGATAAYLGILLPGLAVLASRILRSLDTLADSGSSPRTVLRSPGDVVDTP